MHSALFVATMPKDREDAWETFLNRVSSKTKAAKSSERLSENVWLIDMTSDPGPLGYLISFAHEGHIEYRIFPFPLAPQWLRGGSGSKPN